MKKDNEKTNKGFSLFTVIIAVAFIAILGLLIIYISVSNFYMKVTDLKSKDGFYTAERGLEEIKVGLQQDVGTAMSKAFTEVMENYDKENSENQSQSAERQSRFQKSFIEKLKDLLKDKERSSDNGVLYYNIDYLEDEDHLNKGHVLTDESKESLLLVSGGEPYIQDMKTVQNGQEEITGIILKNLKIIYVDAKGRASIIKTDICLGTPQVRFPTSSTLPDLMNMVVVANGGIICEEGSDITLKGNIYAGLLKNQDSIDQINTTYGPLKEYGNKTSIWVKRGASLSVESNNMLVTQAEVNVDHSEFSTGPKVQLWTRGITVGSSLSNQANVTLQGTSYVADDITVASGTAASDANITLEGTYYGYGSVESEEKLKKELEERGQKADKAEEKELYKTVKDGCVEQYEGNDHSDKYSTADLSSAIMINGKNTTLDLSKVTKMLLSGKSYVSTSKSTEGDDVLTGESITVKGSQLAYLAPTEILGNETEDSSGLTNPLECTDENKAKWSILSDDGSISVKRNASVEIWGGKTLNDLEAQGINLNKNQPVQRVIYRDPGGNPYAYFYLNFAADDNSSDSTNASKYMQFYYENNGDMKTKMDNYFAFYFNNDNSGIFVNDEEAYARYITNGNILSFETDDNSEKKQGKLYEGAEENTISGLVDTSVTNRLKWYALNRKMIDNYGNLNVKKTDSDPETEPHNEASYSQSVFDNIVNENKMVRYLHENYADKNYKCQYPEEESGNGPQVIMYDNEKGTPLEITSDMVDTLRLVVCTGDVVIDNVEFTGIIMTKGKITLKAGATLQTSPIEAANVFQAQMGANTELKPEDFFWDGNNYVRGNTTTDDDSTDEMNLADYVYYQNWKKQ